MLAFINDHHIPLFLVELLLQIGHLSYDTQTKAH